ncbi:mitochondrial thiamine pyrophosphate carrier-like isoform X2 [Paramacrobiotus metropolitanus]|uniref:mitochondrial thiamine pyrophosphate carrier-like isoform X2 n=1 Tax=Paramacrobiotus metropolitanus TaxID=2943436 RepID=UPI0024460384|nr:mitochondrial thiamine pyrophosphate carrier-like isoform X2 [Paramacrobiotus metropolitanus]
MKNSYVCKIRFQLQVEPIKRTSLLSKYRSLPQACTLIVREEGLAALWKGIIPGQALSAVYGLAEFATFEFLNKTLFAWNLTSNPKDPLVYFLCGSVAGMVGTVVSQPLDVVRTRLVSQGRDKVYTSLMDSFRQIKRQEGYRGFYRGLLPGLLQIAPSSGLSFAFYSQCQILYRKWSGKRITESKSDAMESLFCGCIAGAASKSIVHPLDVLKKRLQVQGFEQGRKGFGLFLFASGIVHLIRETYRLEGLHGFLKGFSPALLKATSSTGFTFFFYEQFLRGFSQLLV